MKPTITTETVIAYDQCPRKAFLLLFGTQSGSPHEYVQILAAKQRTNQTRYLEKLAQEQSDVVTYQTHGLASKQQMLTAATLKTEGFEAECGLLTKVASHSALGHYSYEPTIFVGTHTISKEQKLALFFTGRVLAELQTKAPAAGQIIDVTGKAHGISLTESVQTLLPVLEPLNEWVNAASLTEPPVILNDHCPLCQFCAACRSKAEQENNLSLLDRMTPKIIRKYERKGIFTVTQLSYTFKPRKRKKRTKNLPPVTHKLELQALAIREKKIYLEELPAITRQPVELFLDIEGIPDQNSYYLFGLLVCEGETSTHHAFWADTLADEAKIWQQFVDKANTYPDAPIYHYGNYEAKAIKKLAQRYATDGEPLLKRLVNVNGFIYGKVYFPIYSNRLKEIGQFIGAKWSAPEASGLQSLVWRHYWEERRDAEMRQLLVLYNREDCEALKLLTDELAKIKDSADVLSEVNFADKPKSNMNETSEEVHSQFKTILRFAHSNYDQKKISFQANSEETEASPEQKPQTGHQRQRRVRPRPTRTIWVPPCQVCPIYPNEKLQSTEHISTRLIVDLELTRSGIRKTITEYKGYQGHCRKCQKFHIPPEFQKFGASKFYGHGLKAWFVYQRVALRTPYEKIAESYEEQFNSKLPLECSAFVKELSKYYVETERTITQRLLANHVVHADETPVNIYGVTQYVWVFTDGENTIFRLGEGREATIAHEFLAEFSGILISDFYSGYDSIDCIQQKCWVHLIREMNTDLRQSPFDKEYETFIVEVRNLIIPIMKAVQQYGLKRRNLNKFQKDVDKFYKKSIDDVHYKSELVLRYQKRFTRYRESLFIFLHYDNVPWQNNAAERGLRHLALQRAISPTFHKSFMPHYLRLLGIHQTCRFQGKSFFKFLFSGETDLDEFQKSKRSRKSPT